MDATTSEKQVKEREEERGLRRGEYRGLSKSYAEPSEPGPVFF
jgi:hypothetical protein